MTNEEWAYAAGILDGEGHIYVRPSGNVEVRFSNGDTTLLDWLEARFRGSRQISRNSRRNPNARDIERLILYQKDSVRRCLLGCLPYLVCKRARAEKTLKLLELSGQDKLSASDLIRAERLRGLGV